MTLLSFNRKYVVSSNTLVSTTSTSLVDDPNISQTFELTQNQTVLVFYTSTTLISDSTTRGTKNAINVNGIDHSFLADSGAGTAAPYRNQCFWVGTLAAGTHTIKGRYSAVVTSTKMRERNLVILIFNGNEFFYTEDSNSQTYNNQTYLDNPYITTTVNPSANCNALILYSVTNYTADDIDYSKKIRLVVGGSAVASSETFKGRAYFKESLLSVHMQAISGTTAIKGQVATHSTNSAYIDRENFAVLLFDPTVIFDLVSNTTSDTFNNTTLADDAQASISRSFGGELLAILSAATPNGTAGNNNLGGYQYALNINNNDLAVSRSGVIGSICGQSDVCIFAQTVSGLTQIKGRRAINVGTTNCIINRRNFLALWFPTVSSIDTSANLSIHPGYQSYYQNPTISKNIQVSGSLKDVQTFIKDLPTGSLNARVSSVNVALAMLFHGNYTIQAQLKDLLQGLIASKNLTIQPFVYIRTDPLLVTSIDLYLHKFIDVLSYLPATNNNLEISAAIDVRSFEKVPNLGLQVEALYTKTDYYEPVNSNLSISLNFSPIRDLLQASAGLSLDLKIKRIRDFLELNPNINISSNLNLFCEVLGNFDSNLSISPDFALITHGKIDINADLNLFALSGHYKDKFSLNQDLNLSSEYLPAEDFIKLPPAPISKIVRHYDGYDTTYFSGYPIGIGSSTITKRDIFRYSRGLAIAQAQVYVVDMGICTPHFVISGQEPLFIASKNLSDFDLISARLSKSTTDSLWSCSMTFPGGSIPDEFQALNLSAEDYLGNTQMLFRGFSPDIQPTISDFKSVTVNCFDFAWYISNQPLQDDSLVINLQGDLDTWKKWVIHLLEGTGVTPYRIADIDLPDKTFIYQGGTKKRQALDDISSYCNCLFEVKFFNEGTQEDPNWNTGAFWILPEDLDDINKGLELPDPIILDWPNEHMSDMPALSTNPENKYNSVRVKGTDGQGNYYTALVQTSFVRQGILPAIEFYTEDSDCKTQEQTDEKAANLFNYFQKINTTFKGELIKRFDVQLYQRVKFGPGFPEELFNLTKGTKGINYLRVISIVYNISHNDNFIEITLISDSPDTILRAHQGEGSFTDIDETSIIAGPVQSTQAYVLIGQCYEISPDGKTAVVETEDGKIITARIII